MFDLATSDVDRYEGEHGDDVQEDEEEEHLKPIMHHRGMWRIEGIVGLT